MLPGHDRVGGVAHPLAMAVEGVDPEPRRGRQIVFAIAGRAARADKSLEATVLPEQVGEFVRPEEHTSELQSLMRISYAVFCLKKKKNQQNLHTNQVQHNIKIKDKNTLTTIHTLNIKQHIQHKHE